MKWNIPICVILVLFAAHSTYGTVRSKVIARFSENGIHGIITIKESTTDDIVLLSSSLYTSENASIQASWSIRQFPVDYTSIEQRCHDNVLGHATVDLDSMFGLLNLNKEVEFSASVNILSITGIQGIWMSSMLIILPDGKRSCSTLIVSDDAELKIAVAKFYGPIYGSVYLFWIGITGSSTDAIVLSDLQHVRKRVIVHSEHNWGIFTTDTLDTMKDKARLQCNALQLSYNGVNDPSKKSNQLKAGDRCLYRDPTLSLIDLYQKSHNYYLAIYDDIHNDSFIACAPVVFASAITLRAHMEYNGTRGEVTLYQRSPFEPTMVNISVIGNQNFKDFYIHEVPPIPRVTAKSRNLLCDGVKNIYNPLGKKVVFDVSITAHETQDMYAIGDIYRKIKYAGNIEWDLYLPLSGKHSVLHRSFVMYRNNASGIVEPWICGSLIPIISPSLNQKLPMITAQAVIRYPLAGRVIFRQLSDHVYSDTVIIVESLVYSDGSSFVDSFHHNWTINELPPGKDYYDWQTRCNSTGSVFNPYKVPISAHDDFVSSFSFAHLSSNLATLSVAGEKSKSNEVSRNLFIHPHIHLSGIYSIIGRSFVIFDENGPKARGNRLACSKIVAVNRRKAVARDWFGNGSPVSIMGKIEMYQYSEYDSVDIELDLTGLHDNSAYHIHMVSVMEELEFPCENSTLHGVWNPYNISKTDISSSYMVNSKTYDQYRAGDWSAKFGFLDNLNMMNAAYNDSSIQLFGPLSILGRSVIIHEKYTNRRSACATIERGYALLEARELRAIASFHHPNGFAYGYVRMTQLIHIDGSKSDVVIEVNLRYPGRHNRNVTHNHLWMIYVNPVSVDATVSVKLTRCTAGGYIWNPYFTQLADPINEELYFRECGADHPLRCYAGDVSGRLGSISIGAERRIFSDPYLSLEGDDSIMGRSIVLLDKNFGNDRFACANIEPDKDIVKYANIRKTPYFVASEFLADVREVLGIPDWMLTADNRKTKLLYNGACIQFHLHFKGPEASKIELDFSRLLRTGHVSSPSIYIPGYVAPQNKKKSLRYASCPVRENDSKRKVTGNGTQMMQLPFLAYFIGFVTACVLS